MTVLITNPNYDPTTHYLFWYTKEVIQFAEQKGIKLLNLERPKLNKENFTKMVKKQQPTLFILNGHGDETTIYGDKLEGAEEAEALIKEDDNHRLLEGKIVYARSCYAAASLGKKIAKTSGCFVGYNIPFQFYINAELASRPLLDETARLFLEPSNYLAKALLKGKTAEQSAEKFNSATKKTILRLLSNQKEPGSMMFIKALWMNMQGQTIIGDSSLFFSN